MFTAAEIQRCLPIKKW